MTEEFPSIIDNSLMSKLHLCPQAFFNYGIRKRVLTEPSYHLNAGKAYASGLEAMRKNFFRTIDKEQALIAAFYIAIKDYAEDVVPPKNAYKSLNEILTGLETYMETWPLENDFGHLAFNTSEGVEFTFAIPLDTKHPETGEPLLYAGKIDFILNDQGILTSIDDKTASYIDAKWISSWATERQFTGYVWALRQYEINVQQVLVRGMQFNAKGCVGIEARSFRSKGQVENWKQSLESKLEEAISYWKKGFFPRVSHIYSCYGKFPCDYAPVCAGSQALLDAPFYKESTWSPLKEVD